MKLKFLSLSLGFLLFFPSFSSEAGARKKAEFLPYVPNEIIIELAVDDDSHLISPKSGSVLREVFNKHGVPAKSRVFSRIGISRKTMADHYQASLLNKNNKRKDRGPREKKLPPLNRFFKLSFPSDIDVMQVIGKLRTDPLIKSASPNYLMRLETVPNDPYYSSLGSWGQGYNDMWGLEAIGVEEAWDVTTGNPNVIVGVLDSGLDLTHEDIVDNIFSNDVEVAGMGGADDDGNGFVDDIYGYDFVNADADPTDDHGHGTHVSGTIAGRGNNTVGIVGVMWEAKILPVKVCDENGYCSASDVADGLTYAVDNGADVINMSFGGLGTDTSVQEAAIEYAYNLGVVLVAAAGNDSTDAAIHYPSAYPEVISAGSSTTQDKLSSFSNYGIDIDFTAPGGGDGSGDSNYERNILSLRASNTDMYGEGGNEIVGSIYYRAQGTSMASPHAAGVAGLLLSHDPSLTVEEVRQIIRQSADDIANSGWDTETGYGRINAFQALNTSIVCEAIILSPNNYDVESYASLEIIGSAGGRSFVSYALDIGSGNDPVTWQSIVSGSSSVSGGVLGTYITSSMFGVYTLRLQVYDGGGGLCGTDYKIFQFSGITAETSFTDASASYLNEGFSLAAGDINGDGIDDLLMGAPGGI